MPLISERATRLEAEIKSASRERNYNLQPFCTSLRATLNLAAKGN
jgi:hypothetical protein